MVLEGGDDDVGSSVVVPPGPGIGVVWLDQDWLNCNLHETVTTRLSSPPLPLLSLPYL